MELIAHEVLGHGFGYSIGSNSAKSHDAIQMTNLYWRAQGKYHFFRDGSHHGKDGYIPKFNVNLNKLPLKMATEIPYQFHVPSSLKPIKLPSLLPGSDHFNNH